MRLRPSPAAVASLALCAATFANLPARAGDTGPNTTLRPARLAGLAPDASPDLSYGSGNLTSHGGPVENGSVNYLVFWGVPDVTYACQAAGCNLAIPSTAPLAPRIANFFQDVSTTHVYGVLAQYGITGASTLGGVYSDVTPYPTTTLTDADVQNELRKAEAAMGWTGGLGHNLWLITGPGERECAPGLGCSGTDFCGYHGTLSDRAGVTTPYAMIPYPENAQASCSATIPPNAVPGEDDAINIISHELFEILTDPHLNAWYDAAGWEIADKCAWMFSAPQLPRGGNETAANGDTYRLQMEYSNSLGDCTL